MIACCPIITKDTLDAPWKIANNYSDMYTSASQKVKLAFIEELQINNQAYKLTIAVLHLSDVEENLKERYLIYSN